MRVSLAPLFSLSAACSPALATRDNSAAQLPESQIGKIKHIVVLMLENRSFDNLLGKLYPKSSHFNGLSGDESNFFTKDGVKREIKVWNGINRKDAMNHPNPDPNEDFSDMKEQLFGSTNPDPGAEPNMSGFAQNYYKVCQPADPDAIMHYYLPEQVPVLSQLARNYAVCDAWFAAAPCQTWPNRFFVHSATAVGYENNSPPHFPYKQPTIFTRFNEKGIENGWKIYYHDFPQSAVLSNLWLYHDKFQHYSQFKLDAANGTLPSYSFIEPQYFAEVDFPSDQHPPHDVRFGDRLIADVYNTLQSSPNWKQTMFIILYDEHGGCYDHVPPPKVASPETSRSDQPFGFNRLGVRVPAVVVSPYIPAGTVFRAKAHSQPFDHTSVISTLRRCFDLGKPLTERDRHAPNLSRLLSLPDDRLNLGAPIIVPAVDDAPELLQKLKEREISEWQKSLQTIAAYLPNLQGIGKETASLLERIDRVVASLVEGEKREVPQFLTHDESLTYVREQLDGFLQQAETVR